MICLTSHSMRNPFLHCTNSTSHSLSEKREGRRENDRFFLCTIMDFDLPTYRKIAEVWKREEEEKMMNFTQLLVTLGCLVVVACTKQGDLLSTSTIKKYGE